MNDTTPRTSRRTWNATVTYRECGVITERVTHTVTLIRTPAGIEAAVNGEPCDLTRALNLLQGADLELVAEAKESAPIGKPRAAKLHRLMGRAGIPSREHYGLAAVALERPVFSLAALTEPEARQVWGFLKAAFPEVVQVAA